MNKLDHDLGKAINTKKEVFDLKNLSHLQVLIRLNVYILSDRLVLSNL